MSDAHWKALGMRALLAGFEWAPGALRCDGARYIGVEPSGTAEPQGAQVRFDYGPWEHADHGPDLRDSATLGVMLEQVRLRFGEPIVLLYADPPPDGLVMPVAFSNGGDLRHRPIGVPWCPSEAEALVEALEAAP